MLYRPLVKRIWSILNISLTLVVPLPDNAPCVNESHLFRNAVPSGSGEVVVKASLLAPFCLRVSPAINPEKYRIVGVDNSRPGYLKSVAFIVHTRESPLVRSTCRPTRPVNEYCPSAVAMVAAPPVATAICGFRRLTTQVSTRPSLKVIFKPTDSFAMPLIGRRSTETMLLTPVLNGSMTLTNKSCNVPEEIRWRMMPDGRVRPRLLKKFVGTVLSRAGTGVVPR